MTLREFLRDLANPLYWPCLAGALIFGYALGMVAKELMSRRKK